MITDFGVTPRHIKAGTPKAYEGCPLVYTISEKVLSYLTIEVLQTRVLVNYHGNEVSRMDLPEAMIAWVAAYDAGQPVAPVDFQLDVEKELLRNEYIRTSDS